MAHPARSKRAGISLIESLVAAVIIAAAAMGVISVFGFGYGITLSTADTSEAYNVSRDALEQVRLKGFYNAPEGAATSYYNRDGSGPNATAGTNTLYKVVTTITSDKLQTSGTTTSPAEDAVRAVKIVVTNYRTNAVLFTTGTNLARAGI